MAKGDDYQTVLLEQLVDQNKAILEYVGELPGIKHEIVQLKDDVAELQSDMPDQHERLMTLYQQQAKAYDQSGIQGQAPFRREAVKRLHLKPGDLVVDIGCGTGLNFPWLQEAVGPQGSIIGVDVTAAMLEQARCRIVEAGWKNVELVQVDAASYGFPAQVQGILSTFALTFIP